MKKTLLSLVIALGFAACSKHPQPLIAHPGFAVGDEIGFSLAREPKVYIIINGPFIKTPYVPVTWTGSWSGPITAFAQLDTGEYVAKIDNGGPEWISVDAFYHDGFDPSRVRNH